MFKFSKYGVLSRTLVLLTLCVGPIAGYASNADCGVVEIKPTEEEFTRLGKWADKDFECLVKDAIQGDDAGLFLIGYAYLTGRMGQAINVESANSFFAMSASLGFPPAIDQITLMYIHDKGDPFLAMVYRNLAASYGHPELIKPYHDLRSKLIARFGPKSGQRIAAEIERIAEEKRKMIEKNREDLKLTQNLNGEFNKVIFYGDIIRGDILYTNEYWQQVAEGKVN